MGTQIDEARQGRVTPAMRAVATVENVSAEQVLEDMAAGRAVIPANPAHTSLTPVGVGCLFRTKINANIGCSTESSSCGEEIEKLQVALSAGADFMMDLSVGPNVKTIRKALLQACPAPLGTVPIYEAFSRADGQLDGLTGDLLLEVIREQAEEGVDFMTLHAGLLKNMVGLATQRLMGIVSRGGCILAEWMSSRRQENPLYVRWDEILDICHTHDVTLSLGDGLRPGCLADASDEAQFSELEVLGELVRRCREKGVQVMVEGPGHVPFDQIQMNMEKEQELCDGAPFYVLGPVVTDVAPGRDHITSCIGATAAAYYGASLLCYVTPAEHLCLPTLEDVKEGVVAYRIAAHAGDVARKLPGARDWDDAMARARLDLDWKKQFSLALDGDTARRRHEESRQDNDENADHCSMCGKEFCSIRGTRRLKQKALEE